VALAYIQRMNRLPLNARSAILAAIGALLLALPVVIDGRGIRVLIGAAIGALVLLAIVWTGYLNRKKAPVRKGLPRWGFVFVFFGAFFGFSAAEVGGGEMLLGFFGGILLTLAVAQVLFRRHPVS
jgi:hypothetical protein